MVDELFTTPVYSRRRGRFTNSAFPNKKNLVQKSKFVYDKQIWKRMFAEILSFKEIGQRMLHEDDVLPRGTEPPFLSALHAKTFSVLNLVSQQKTTKLFFSSQVRKQFKLLTVPLNPLRCCLRSDRLVNCHVWNCYNLFLNFRVIWSVNQIVLSNI